VTAVLDGDAQALRAGREGERGGARIGVAGARLPGGGADVVHIVISEATQTRPGADLPVEDLGVRELKNVETPLRLFRLR